MTAACLLRLKELRRRGGLALLALACAGVFALGLGGYGLASDLAALFGYVLAALAGAFPLALDREHRRAHLAAAAPVTPWAWALGNGLGAAAASALATFALFAAAGLGAAAGGGVPTHVVSPLDAHGIVWLTPTGRIGVPPDAHALRTEVRVYLTAEEAVGAPGTVALRVDGREVRVRADEPVVLPAAPPRVEISNPDATRTIGLVAEETRALGAPRPFLGNALLAAAAPALAAAALAALGAAAGAHLSAPVAALLLATLLLIASLKGFLLEMWEHEGAMAHAIAGEAEHDHEGHDHGPAPRAPAAAKRAMRALLAVVPDLPALDASDRVGRGEWTGPARAARAAAFAALALLVAAGVGGLGVRTRRAM
jgi:hypothetical protein